ncbi:MAG: hypothetical protein ACLGXA_08015 [Acidobacteriota bacterium]
MRFEPHDISLDLAHLLISRANRSDLVADGFDIDDAVLARHRHLARKHHGDKSRDRKEAIAIYGALFDANNFPHVPSAIADPVQGGEGPAATSDERLVEGLSGIMRVESAGLRGAMVDLMAGTADSVRNAAKSLEAGMAEASAARAKEARQAIIGRWIQIILLILIALLLATHARAQSKNPLILEGYAAGSPISGATRSAGVFGIDCGATTTFASNILTCPGTATLYSDIFDGSTTTLQDGSVIVWTSCGTNIVCTNWTIPSGVHWVAVEEWGGGAAGIGGTDSATTAQSGAGGAGGGYGVAICPVVPGNSYVIQVGLGGVSPVGWVGGLLLMAAALPTSVRVWARMVGLPEATTIHISPGFGCTGMGLPSRIPFRCRSL